MRIGEGLRLGGGVLRLNFIILPLEVQGVGLGRAGAAMGLKNW